SPAAPADGRRRAAHTPRPPGTEAAPGPGNRRGEAPWERLDELEEYRALCRTRLQHLVEVREPLVFVSQIQRSGGTLLSRLLDGHPECHAHPYEARLGHKSKWPVLDLAAPDEWFGR